jgi:hypothetical protein
MADEAGSRAHRAFETHTLEEIAISSNARRRPFSSDDIGPFDQTLGEAVMVRNYKTAWPKEDGRKLQKWAKTRITLETVAEKLQRPQATVFKRAVKSGLSIRQRSKGK